MAALALFALLGQLLVAEPGPSWEAPLACPDREWVRGRVEAYLGRTLDEDDAGVEIRGRVRDGGARGYVLELRVEAGGRAQTRELHAQDCARLGELAASLAAIAIDPLAAPPRAMEAAPDWRRPMDEPASPGAARRREVPVQRPRTRAVAREAAPPSPARRPRPVAEPPRPKPLALEPLPPPVGERDEPSAPPQTSAVKMLVIANGGLSLGLFPDPAPQVHGGLGVDVRPPASRRWGFRAELEGGAVLAGRFRSPSDPEIGGNLSAWELAARPCAVPRWRRVELRACAALGGGQLRGRGVGVQDPQLGTQPWLWAGAGAGLAVSLHPKVAVFVDLGASFNLLRPHFVVEAPRADWVVPSVSGRGRLGLEIRLF